MPSWLPRPQKSSQPCSFCSQSWEWAPHQWANQGSQHCWPEPTVLRIERNGWDWREGQFLILQVLESRGPLWDLGSRKITQTLKSQVVLNTYNHLHWGIVWGGNLWNIKQCFFWRHFTSKPFPTSRQLDICYIGEGMAQQGEEYKSTSCFSLQGVCRDSINSFRTMQDDVRASLLLS